MEENHPRGELGVHATVNRKGQVLKHCVEGSWALRNFQRLCWGGLSLGRGQNGRGGGGFNGGGGGGGVDSWWWGEKEKSGGWSVTQGVEPGFGSRARGGTVRVQAGRVKTCCTSLDWWVLVVVAVECEWGRGFWGRPLCLVLVLVKRERGAGGSPSKEKKIDWLGGGK